MDYPTFFTDASGLSEPYDYQCRLAAEEWPDLLSVPTGMGKTIAVMLAWLWKRGWRQGGRSEAVDPSTPRRLVWCLPMRVLVEQTQDTISSWLKNLGVLGLPGEGKVSVHVLMGGADDTRWSEFPGEDVILIGTQDMLLSRALMRGYGMSRYQWPMHFALLHNDCLWVFDEVQSMGAGLPTSTQLEAFRRSFPLARRSRSLWVSATLNRDWLATVDFKQHLSSLKALSLGDRDRQQAGGLLNAIKGVKKLELELGESVGSKDGLERYLKDLAAVVLHVHDAGCQTIVILNTVARAQGLFRLLRKERPQKPDILIHSHFRAADRVEKNRAIRNIEESVDRIVVATQAVEAGVDVSSGVLVTELAPWSSLVQRFGRCNRFGEHNAKGAMIYWVDIDEDKDALLPYDAASVASARGSMAALVSASPEDLPPVNDARPLTAVLRRKDLLELFNTDPDLSGFDVDVSDYIRDSGRPGIQVFWRAFSEGPNQPEPQGSPVRAELCPISMGQADDIFKGSHKRDLWYWDALGDKKGHGRWVKLDRAPRPGMTALLRSSDGCYDAESGFDAAQKKLPVPPIISDQAVLPTDDFGGDWRSRQKLPIPLVGHMERVGDHLARLCEAVGEEAHRRMLVRAGFWHDVGKGHPVFQHTMHVCTEAPEGFLAKSPCNGRHERRFFRHELASALAWLAQHNGEPDADLIAYLIAAHHGKVRMSLRAMPTEEAPPGVKRFARGIWEGDELPALEFGEDHSDPVKLSLALMELGDGEQGPSWTARTLRLLEQNGPFELAWLETLIRLADWRASDDEQAAGTKGRA